MGNLSTLADKVRSTFVAEFPPPDEIGLSIRDGIVVFVTSPRFEGLDDPARQNLVWGLLDRSLTIEERRAVSIVVALTPKERSFHLAAAE